MSVADIEQTLHAMLREMNIEHDDLGLTSGTPARPLLDGASAGDFISNELVADIPFAVMAWVALPPAALPVRYKQPALR